LTFHLLVADLEKAFAFAIPAFLFLRAGVLHDASDRRSHAYARAIKNASLALI
jgi:hypothetical protein